MRFRAGRSGIVRLRDAGLGWVANSEMRSGIRASLSIPAGEVGGDQGSH